MGDRAAVGRAGEELAAREYELRGFRVLARNWRCSLGELDLVLARGGLLVVCEVKTRRGSTFGYGFDAVTRRKQTKLRALTEAFLQSQHQDETPEAIRFDVASIDASAGGASAELYEDAF